MLFSRLRSCRSGWDGLFAYVGHGNGKKVVWGILGILNYTVSKAKMGKPGWWDTFGITVGGINDAFLGDNVQDIVHQISIQDIVHKGSLTIE